MSSVEEQIRTILNEDIDLVAVNLPDEKKGEKIVVLVSEQVDTDVIKRNLIDRGCNPLMIPSSFIAVDEVPKLGSGKTDFKGAKSKATSLIEVT